MVISQAKSKKSTSGARYKPFRRKRQFEAGGKPSLTSVGEDQRKNTRTLGGNIKTRLKHAQTINLVGKDKKCVKATIKTVLENPANRHFVRRNIITKGTILETDKGKAKVTSRPGQDGIINAVLI